MDLSAVALWGNLAALAVTTGLLYATLRRGRRQPSLDRQRIDPRG